MLGCTGCPHPTTAHNHRSSSPTCPAARAKEAEAQSCTLGSHVGHTHTAGGVQTTPDAPSRQPRVCVRPRNQGRALGTADFKRRPAKKKNVEKEKTPRQAKIPGPSRSPPPPPTHLPRRPLPRAKLLVGATPRGLEGGALGVAGICDHQSPAHRNPLAQVAPPAWWETCRGWGIYRSTCRGTQPVACLKEGRL